MGSPADTAVSESDLWAATAGMMENVSAAVRVSGKPGHPLHDCCCSCPYGTDRYCSPVSGSCYTERVDDLKPYYQLCYGPEAPLACPAGGESFEWWWHKWTQMEFMECKVGHGSQTGDVRGFEVQDVEECAMHCDYADWCESFSLDISSSPLRCFMLGDLDMD